MSRILLAVTVLFAFTVASSALATDAGVAAMRRVCESRYVAFGCAGQGGKVKQVSTTVFAATY